MELKDFRCRYCKEYGGYVCYNNGGYWYVEPNDTPCCAERYDEDFLEKYLIEEEGKTNNE